MTNLFPPQKLASFASLITNEEVVPKIEIIQAWLDNYRSGRLDARKETSAEQKYNQDIFMRVLGYHQEPPIPYTFEPKASTSGGLLPDAIVGYLLDVEDFRDQKVSAVVELKGSKVLLDKPQQRENNQSPVRQAFSYKPLYKKCSFVIVSNFYELRLYHDNQHDYEVWTLDDLCDPREDFLQFKKFYYLLNVNNFVSGEPGGISQTESFLSDIRVDQKVIGDLFYGEYKEARLKLLRSLYDKNDVVKDDVNFGVEKAQKIIDRIVFICFAEDRGLLPDNSLQRLLRSSDTVYTDIWQNLKGFFRAIDQGDERLEIPEGYNGGLFAADDSLDRLFIEDDALRDLANLGDYDFREQLSVQVLGHIFEQSVSDIEEIKKRPEVSIENKKQVVTEFREHSQQEKNKRQREAIFYTPDSVVKTIVDNSLGRYVRNAETKFQDDAGLKEDIKPETYATREKVAYENYSVFLRNLKICDPACGSGAFLVYIFDFLLSEHRRVSEVLRGDFATLFDTDTYVREILTNNIYGVDLSVESVEITKLSLWLKSAQKGKQLTTLSNNIRCGNSLMDGIGASSEKNFNWEDEFPEIFEKGGFDVIVGNPPYGISVDTSYFDGKESYMAFFVRAIQLLKPGGNLSFISPDSWLVNDNAATLREYFVDKGTIQGIHDVYKVFRDAPDVWCTITSFSKSISKSAKVDIDRDAPYDLPRFQFKKDWSYFLERRGSRWFPYINEQTEEIFKTIESSGGTINNFFDVKRGFSFTPNAKNVTQSKTERQVIGGEDFGRYESKIKPKFLVDSYEKSLKQIADVSMNPFVAIQRIRTNSRAFESRWLVANHFAEGYIPNDSVGYCLPKLSSDLFALLGVINSKLLNFYYKLHYTDKNVKPIFLNELPYPAFTDLQQEKLSTSVRTILSLKTELDKSNRTFKSALMNRFDIQKFPEKISEWWTVDFDFFTKTLNLKASLSDTKELLEYFEENQPLLLTTALQKEATELNIDQLVYAGFGLAADEVAILNSSYSG